MLRMVLLILSLLGSAYYVLSTLALVSHFFGKNMKLMGKQSQKPKVSILKPVCGSNSESLANYRSFMAQGYPDCEVFFGALDPTDPALADVHQAAAGFGSISILAGKKTEGYNNKCLILDNLMQHAAGEIVIIADADTRISPDAVDRIIAPFYDPEVGLVTCAYKGVNARTATDAIEAIYMTCTFEPGVACAKALHIGFCLGAIMAIRRSVLDKIGGFGPISDYLADDFKLGAMVRKAGYKVVLSDYVVDIVMSGENLQGVLARQLRWSTTLRVCNPLGHFGLIVTHGFTYSLFFAILSGFSTVGWAVLLGTTCVRLITAWVGAGICLQDREFLRRAHLIPVADLVYFFTWAAAYFSRTVTWRGRRLKLAKDGRIIEASNQ